MIEPVAWMVTNDDGQDAYVTADPTLAQTGQRALPLYTLDRKDVLILDLYREMELTFEDALRIARGCTDYGGGHRGNAEHYEIYQHGIQTVINALTTASKTGLEDMQTRALHTMGANARLNGTP